MIQIKQDMAAERGTEKITVEVKAFRNPSPVAALEQAIGHYLLYEDILQILQPDRVLYLNSCAFKHRKLYTAKSTSIQRLAV